MTRIRCSSGRSTSASAVPPSVAAGPPAGGAAEESRRPSTPEDAWTAAGTRVSGRREGTRSAGTRVAIIDDRDALLQVGSTLMTCLYGVFGNYSNYRPAGEYRLLVLSRQPRHPGPRPGHGQLPIATPGQEHRIPVARRTATEREAQLRRTGALTADVVGNPGHQRLPPGVAPKRVICARLTRCSLGDPGRIY